MWYMRSKNDVHLGTFDLNLLVALLTERSVTRAAARIGITQSAASHALARLRKLTGDELLVRGRDGMVPTVRAGPQWVSRLPTPPAHHPLRGRAGPGEPVEGAARAAITPPSHRRERRAG
jgi:DNA-binding transcriptional ArsR family regulator